METSFTVDHFLYKCCSHT